MRDHKDGGSVGTAPTNALLGRAVWMATWPTPTVNDSTGSDYSYSQSNHDKPTLKLPGAAKLATWPTPRAADGDKGVCRVERQGKTGQDLPTISGWATPTASQPGGTAEQSLARKAKIGGIGLSITDLGMQAQSWCPAPATAPGATPSGSPAPTASRGQLNPDH
ncbi:MAG: hypothetical protein VW547_09720, partial [Alphaproteobacteria bacterium]